MAPESVIRRIICPLFEDNKLLLPRNHQGQKHHLPQETHRSEPLLRVDYLIYSTVPNKTTWVLDSCYFIILGFGLGFNHKEPTKTHSDLNRSPQQLRKTHESYEVPPILSGYL
jgi:hypothetical protein